MPKTAPEAPLLKQPKAVAQEQVLKQPVAHAILVLHGPNLNLLGTREPEIYGRLTLTDIDQNLARKARSRHIHLQAQQSNAEHVLIEAIHQARAKFNFIIINPAAFTHTSVAVRDALLAVAIPFIEVHLSNVYAREPFRKHSYFSDVAVGVISGFGARSYELALDAAIQYLSGDQSGHGPKKN